jgi:hypothetical protein
VPKAIRTSSTEALDIEFGSLYPAPKRLDTSNRHSLVTAPSALSGVPPGTTVGSATVIRAQRDSETHPKRLRATLPRIIDQRAKTLPDLVDDSPRDDVPN